MDSKDSTDTLVEEVDEDVQFFTINELANLLRVSHAYAHSLIATKEIIALNFGKGEQRAMWRIPRDEVERWLRSRGSNITLKDPSAPRLVVDEPETIDV